MEQDTSRDPEPTPEPPEPPEDKGPKLEKAIYEVADCPAMSFVFV